MDIMQLCGVLSATTSADAAQRHAAEETLKQVRIMLDAANPRWYCSRSKQQHCVIERQNALVCLWVEGCTAASVPHYWPVGASINRLRHTAHGQLALCVRPQYQHSPGQLTNLLRVAVEDSVDAAVRQVAAITFKHLVKADWDQGEQGRDTPILQESATCSYYATML